MKPISKISYAELQNLLNKNIHFTSDCEFFPNFNIIATLLSYKINKTETIFEVKILSNNKFITIGSNMKNLQYEIIDK